jgi:tRNA pseudouridine55 synthase
VNIVVNLNKDRGLSSQAAVTAVKKAFKVRKAGHAGTLDPLATGVLMVCLNEATKIAGLLADTDKEYLVTAKLGESTDTYDAEGTVTKTADPSAVTEQGVRDALRGFVGEQEQLPPMYSAVKVGGEPLYKLARKGLEVERDKRRVTIHELHLVNFDRPFATLSVSCSKGTYIRTLCHDLGEFLGVGSHVTGLVRTRVGKFSLTDAATIQELPLKTSALHTIDDALRHLSELVLTPEQHRRAVNGNPFRTGRPLTPSPLRTERLRLKSPEGKLLGIGRAAADLVKIERLFNL